MIYLDHAATSFPKAPGVAEEAARFLREDAGNPGRGGHSLSARAAAAIERARSGLARLLNVRDARRIALVSGTTEALNVALRGLVGGEVGRVVVGPEAHTSVLRPLWLLARERGIVVDEVSTDDALRWDLDDLRGRLAAGPALVVVTHGSNVTGTVQDLGAIVSIAHGAGCRVLVDGAQTVGALPLDASALELDALAFSGHKALLGPPGTGGLYLREGVEVPPLRVGGTGTHSEEEEPPRDLPAALEAGTPNALGFAGLAVAAAWVRAEGPEALHGRAVASGRALREGLAQRGLAPVAGGREGDLPVLAFNARGWEPQELALALDGCGVAVRAGLHCAPRAHRRLGTLQAGGAVRVSAGPLLGAEAVEGFFAALDALLSS